MTDESASSLGESGPAETRNWRQRVRNWIAAYPRTMRYGSCALGGLVLVGAAYSVYCFWPNSSEKAGKEGIGNAQHAWYTDGKTDFRKGPYTQPAGGAQPSPAFSPEQEKRISELAKEAVVNEMKALGNKVDTLAKSVDALAKPEQPQPTPSDSAVKRVSDHISSELKRYADEIQKSTTIPNQGKTPATLPTPKEVEEYCLYLRDVENIASAYGKTCPIEWLYKDGTKKTVTIAEFALIPSSNPAGRVYAGWKNPNDPEVLELRRNHVTYVSCNSPTWKDDIMSALLKYKGATVVKP